jgi:Copper amine oxidase, enzyme domain
MFRSIVLFIFLYKVFYHYGTNSVIFYVFFRYVFGIIHIPRLEDWPVMPVERIGFMLMVPLSLSLSLSPYIYIYIYLYYYIKQLRIG